MFVVARTSFFCVSDTCYFLSLFLVVSTSAVNCLENLCLNWCSLRSFQRAAHEKVFWDTFDKLLEQFDINGGQDSVLAIKCVSLALT